MATAPSAQNVTKLLQAHHGGEGTVVAAPGGALQALESVDVRKCKVVELRIFGGLSEKETAEVLKVYPGAIVRDWNSTRHGWPAR